MSGTLPYTVFHAKKSYIEKNKDVITKFKNGIQKGLDFIHNNDEETIAKVIHSEFTSTDFNDLVKVIKRYKDADSWWENTTISKESYNNLLDLMEYNNVLKEKIDYNKMVYNE